MIFEVVFIIIGSKYRHCGPMPCLFCNTGDISALAVEKLMMRIFGSLKAVQTPETERDCLPIKSKLSFYSAHQTS